MFYQNEPLWPFAYGLTYSTFSFRTCQSSVNLDNVRHDNATLEVEVQNTGGMTGADVVFVFMKPPASLQEQGFSRCDDDQSAARNPDSTLIRSLAFIGCCCQGTQHEARRLPEDPRLEAQRAPSNPCDAGHRRLCRDRRQRNELVDSGAVSGCCDQRRGDDRNDISCPERPKVQSRGAARHILSVQRCGLAWPCLVIVNEPENSTRADYPLVLDTTPLDSCNTI